MTVAQIILVFAGVMLARLGVLLTQWDNWRHRDFWIDLAGVAFGYVAIFWAVRL